MNSPWEKCEVQPGVYNANYGTVGAVHLSAQVCRGNGRWNCELYVAEVHSWIARNATIAAFPARTARAGMARLDKMAGKIKEALADE